MLFHLLPLKGSDSSDQPSVPHKKASRARSRSHSPPRASNRSKSKGKGKGKKGKDRNKGPRLPPELVDVPDIHALIAQGAASVGLIISKARPAVR